MIRLSQFGAGGIGKIHAANVAQSGRAKLSHVVDVNEAAARALVEAHGGRVSDAETALGDPVQPPHSGSRASRCPAQQSPAGKEVTPAGLK